MFDHAGWHCPFDQADLFVDYWVLDTYSSDSNGLTFEDVQRFLSEGLFVQDEDEAARHLMDYYSQSPDYIDRNDLINFFSDFMYDDDAVYSKDGSKVMIDSWPYEGEIASAMLVLASQLAYFHDGSPVDFAELIIHLSYPSGPEIR